MPTYGWRGVARDRPAVKAFWHMVSSRVNLVAASPGTRLETMCWNASARTHLLAARLPPLALPDLVFTAKEQIGQTYETREALFLLVFFYLLILLPISLIAGRVERRVRANVF